MYICCKGRWNCSVYLGQALLSVPLVTHSHVYHAALQADHQLISAAPSSAGQHSAAQHSRGAKQHVWFVAYRTAFLIVSDDLDI